MNVDNILNNICLNCMEVWLRTEFNQIKNTFCQKPTFYQNTFLGLLKLL